MKSKEVLRVHVERMKSLGLTTQVRQEKFAFLTTHGKYCIKIDDGNTIMTRGCETREVG